LTYVGITQFKGTPLRIKNFDTGYGAGLSLLLLPYNIVRFEVALDEYGNIEYILDIAVSF
jgi:hypothetical protein